MDQIQRALLWWILSQPVLHRPCCLSAVSESSRTAASTRRPIAATSWGSALPCPSPLMCWPRVSEYPLGDTYCLMLSKATWLQVTDLPQGRILQPQRGLGLGVVSPWSNAF